MENYDKMIVKELGIKTCFLSGNNKDMRPLRLKYEFAADSVYFKMQAIALTHGYYYEFESLDDLCGEILEYCGQKFITLEEVKNIVIDICEAGLFDKKLLSNNILTSKTVQQQYLKEAKKLKIDFDKKYWLLDN